MPSFKKSSQTRRRASSDHHQMMCPNRSEDFLTSQELQLRQQPHGGEAEDDAVDAARSSADFEMGKFERRISGLVQHCDHDNILSLEENEEFTLHKLNLARLELYGRDAELQILKKCVEQRVVTAATATTTSQTKKKMSSSTRASSSSPASPSSSTINTSYCSWVSITGHSGSGKTLLAQSLRSFVRKQHAGYFCTGKFDLQNRDEPYTAFATALEELVQQILAQTNASEIQHRVTQALGDDGALLAQIAPALRQLFLPTAAPPNTTTTTTASRDGEQQQQQQVLVTSADKRGNRLRHIFRKFIRAVTAAGNNNNDGAGTLLVMVLDDMQSSDPASLELVEALVTDVENPLYFLITTCRDNEVDDAHIFTKKLDCVDRNDNVSVEHVTVGNLDWNATNKIIATALRSEEDDTRSVAEIIFHKTGGNPFFVLQLLELLVQNDMIVFNFNLLQWQWDENAIRSVAVTGNVADVMTERLRILAPRSLLVLQVAACIGQRFQEAMLCTVIQKIKLPNHLAIESFQVEKAEQQPRDIRQALEEPVNFGLLDRVHNNSSVVSPLATDEFAFVHDQVQNAALRMMAEDELRLLQLRIGECLMEGIDRNEIDSRMFFLAVDLCNSGAPALGKVVQEGLARYNLSAGNHAMKNSAFGTALKYMECGLAYIGPQGWTDNYQLALDLSNGAVEAAYCSGNFEAMEEHMEAVLKLDVPIQDKLRTYLVRIVSFGSSERNGDAVRTGLFVLKALGVIGNVPLRPNMPLVLTEIVKTKLLLRNHTKESLANLPETTDPIRITAMSIVCTMTTNMFCFTPTLLPIMYVKSVRWSVKYGVTKNTPTALSVYGMVCCGLGDFQGARMYGEVALALAERLNAREALGRTLNSIYGFTHHWTSPVRECIKPLLYGHQVAMETGDVEMAMVDVYQADKAYFISGSRRLGTLVAEMEGHVALMHEYQQNAFSSFTKLLWQLAMNIAGQSGGDPLILTGKAVDESQVEKLATDTKNVQLEFTLNCYRMQVKYLFCDYVAAGRYAEKTEYYGLQESQGQLMLPRHYFFRGLSALALALDGRQVWKNIRRARTVLKTIMQWFSAGNVNCLHYGELLKAEIAFVQGETSLAEELYKKSILTSNWAGFLNDKALAHERAARFHMKMDRDPYWARHHLASAVRCYRDWGAVAKVDQLKDLYSALLMSSSSTVSTF